jgi:succinate-acetate transporter protein
VAWQALADRVQITVRPVASPSTFGLFGLAAATFVMSGLQLQWIPADEGRQVAMVLIGFAFVAQLYASIVATLARDVVVSSAMCVLALTWLVTGGVQWTAAPGETSDTLGMLLVFSALAMAAIAATAALTKIVPALVFLTAAIRFGVTAEYELTGSSAWRTAAGLIGLVLFALAIYAGWALLLEAATKRTVLPVGRRGEGATAVHGSLIEQVRDTPIEPGVRSQL